MGIFSKVFGIFGIVGDLLKFLIKRKLWWLIPSIVILLILGLLIVLAQVSGVAPFIYPLL